MACYNEAPYDCTYDSNAGAGKEYSNLDTWETDASVDVSGLGVVLLSCYDSQDHDQDININGSTNENATHYRAIASADDCANPWAGKEGTGANFVCSTASAGIQLSDRYSRVFNLAVKGTISDTGSHYSLVIGQDCKAINVLHYESSNPGSGNYYGSYSQETGFLFFQCISRGIDSRGFYVNMAAGETGGIVCCTAASCGSIGFQNAGVDGTAYLWSCYSMDNSTSAYNEANWDAPSEWNAGDDATADLGGTSSVSWDNSLDLDGSLDADLLATASLDTDDGADHVGEGNCGMSPVNDLSATWDPDSFFTADPLFGFDIAGNARPAGTDARWDVGASEYVTAGGQSIVPLLGDTLGGGCNSMRGM